MNESASCMVSVTKPEVEVATLTPKQTSPVIIVFLRVYPEGNGIFVEMHGGIVGNDYSVVVSIETEGIANHSRNTVGRTCDCTFEPVNTRVCCRIYATGFLELPMAYQVFRAKYVGDGLPNDFSSGYVKSPLCQVARSQ